MHASYLSMYFFFSIVILLGLKRGAHPSEGSIPKSLTYGAVALLTTGIILLSSRMQLLILFLGFLVYVTYQLSGRYGWRTALAGGTGVVVLLFAFSLLFPVNRERLKQAINFGDEYGISSKWGEMQMRPLVWSCAFEIIKESPLVGVGIGSGQDALQACYIRNDYGSLTYFPETRFNAHNQILEIAIQLGLLGLCIWVVSIVYPLALSIRNGNLLYVAFTMIFALSCIPESMLQRQSGITFFAFFNALLYWNNLPLPGLERKSS
jgi:O-antigen ligase